MTPQNALRALLDARALLPTASALRARNIMATAFSAKAAIGGLEPELLIFHAKDGVFTPQLVGAITALGVRLCYMPVLQPSAVAITPEQREFADQVLTVASPLMAGARLFTNPILGIKGTVGCIAIRQGTRGFITCAHVVDDAFEGRLHWPGKTDVIATAQQAQTVKEIPLAAAYGAGFPAEPLRVDAAFVSIASMSVVPSNQVHGLGPAGPLLTVTLPDLSLVNSPVYAAGAASGQRRGFVAGLLYQEYQTTFTAIADYLIASRDDVGRPMSDGGDSGSVWFLESTRQPLALHFGRQLLSFGQRQHVLGLASNLSLALTQLSATL